MGPNLANRRINTEKQGGREKTIHDIYPPYKQDPPA